MKLLYISVIEQHAGWGAEVFFDRGLKKLGHHVIALDYKKYGNCLAEKLFEISDDFDALLLQRGDFFPVELLRAIKRPKFFWASELVSRCRDQDILFKSDVFEHVFVRGPLCKSIISRHQWIKEEKISVLCSGFDEETHFRVESCEKDIDVLFIGSITPRRKAIIEHLRQKFKIGVARALGKDMSLLFNRAKIILNIHAEAHLDTETRVFEALGCGGFLLSEKLAEENPFKNGKHLVEVSSVAEMENKIKYYLENDNERESIALCGYEEALQGHTYTHRALEVTSIMETILKTQRKTVLPIDYHKVASYKADNIERLMK